MAGFLDSESQIIDMVLTGHGKKLLSHGQLRFVYWAAYDDEIMYDATKYVIARGTGTISGTVYSGFTSPPGIYFSGTQNGIDWVGSLPSGVPITFTGSIVGLVSGSTGLAFSYDPSGFSGTMTGFLFEQPANKVEDPLQREATIGYKNFNLRGEDFTNVNRALVTVPPGQNTVPSATFSVANDGLSFQQQPVVQVGPDGSETNMGVIRANSTQIHAYGDYTKNSYPRGHKMDGFYAKILASGTNGYIEQHHTLDDDSRIVIGAQLRVDVDSPGDE